MKKNIVSTLGIIDQSRIVTNEFDFDGELSLDEQYGDDNYELMFVKFDNGRSIEIEWTGLQNGPGRIEVCLYQIVASSGSDIRSDLLRDVECDSYEQAVKAIRELIDYSNNLPSQPLPLFEQGDLPVGVATERPDIRFNRNGKLVDEEHEDAYWTIWLPDGKSIARVSWDNFEKRFELQEHSGGDVAKTRYTTVRALRSAVSKMMEHTVMEKQ